MDMPTLLEPARVAPDTTVIPSYLPVPGLGVLPANAFVIHGDSPVLVDAGVNPLREAFLAALETVIDPVDLRWIWVTHTDADHIGALAALLERAPNARVVTSYLGMGKLGMLCPVPPERVYLINPGQRLDVGDRSLLAFRPPSYDAPETTGAFDERTGVLFSSDAFGAVLDAPRAHLAEVDPKVHRDGTMLWTSFDSPWLHVTDPTAFEEGLTALRGLRPSHVLSSHLPAADGAMTDQLLDGIRAAREAPPAIGPDQAALERMMESAA